MFQTLIGTVGTWAVLLYGALMVGIPFQTLIGTVGTAKALSWTQAFHQTLILIFKIPCSPNRPGLLWEAL